MYFDIVLSAEEVEEVVNTLMIFFLSALFMNVIGGVIFTFPSRKKIIIEEVFSGPIFPSRAVAVIYFLSALVTFSGLINDYIRVSNHGYSADIAGLSSGRSLVEVFSELTFVVISLMLAHRRRRIIVFIILFYIALSMVNGQRMNSLTTALFVIVTYCGLNTGRYLLRFSVLSLAFGIPFLLLVQDFREAVLFDRELSIDGYYRDFWRVVLFTFDTIKLAVVNEVHNIGLQVSPFSRLEKMAGLVLSRFFGADLFAVQELGFGVIFTGYFSPALLDSARTIASSSLAESYYFFSNFGGVFLAVYSYFYATLFSWLHSRGTEAYFVGGFYLVPYFLSSVRNELFGWAWQQFLFALSALLIFWLIKLFLWKKI